MYCIIALAKVLASVAAVLVACLFLTTTRANSNSRILVGGK